MRHFFDSKPKLMKGRGRKLFIAGISCLELTQKEVSQQSIIRFAFFGSRCLPMRTLFPSETVITCTVLLSTGP